MTRRPCFCAVPPVSFSPAVLAPSLDTRSMVVYQALRDKGVEHGGVKIANPMHHDSTVVKARYDIDQVRLYGQHSEPSTNVGTLPFLALDLLDERPPDGTVRSLYRHDAESFAWCLIYICICMEKGSDGRIGTVNPHPLSSWFKNADSCLTSKTKLSRHGLFDKIPLHQNMMSLVSTLHDYWVTCFEDREKNTRNLKVSSKRAGVKVGGGISRLLPPDLVKPKKTVLKTEPYEELPPQEWFRQVFRLLLREINVVPQSKVKVFLEVVNLVATIYPFVRSLGSEEGASC